MGMAALVFTIGSGLLAVAHSQQSWFITRPVASKCPTNPPAAGTYYGVGVKPNSCPTRLRISNGGAGLSGLVGALANEFITYKLRNQSEERFKIEWVKGDTTESLYYLSTGQADVGITYNKAAECQAMDDGVATRKVYGFRDHFYLVGPGPKDNNPAGLRPYEKGKSENVLKQLQKIVRTGNNPNQVPPTRFLSRYDKSATNIKDSELFVTVGQVPWALPYSKWYHQYVMYPIDALIAAAKLGEYTITDRGTWLSTPQNYTDMLVRYNEGEDDNPSDPLLNPAFFLTSKKACDKELANEFLDWVISSEGQEVIKTFKGNSSEYLYTPAPPKGNIPIRNCNITGV